MSLYNMAGAVNVVVVVVAVGMLKPQNCLVPSIVSN
jgi:hypothetical protein